MTTSRQEYELWVYISMGDVPSEHQAEVVLDLAAELLFSSPVHTVLCGR